MQSTFKRDTNSFLKYALSLSIFFMFLLFLTPVNMVYAQTPGLVIENNVLIGYYGTSSNVVIPSGVTRIEENAFYSNIYLQEVTLPNTVQSIGATAFAQCRSLTKINLGNSLKTIEESAFFNCTSLSELTIPSSVTKIGTWAFKDTPWFDKKCESEALVIINGILLYGGNEKGNITIPDSVTMIGGKAFKENKNLTGITLPNSVTTIGNDAFGICTNLKEVKLSDSLTLIDDNAFSNCSKLTDITIPKSVEVLGGASFRGCKNLENIQVKNPNVIIESQTFHGTKWMTKQLKKNTLVILNKNLLDGSQAKNNVVIPKTVTRISPTAFAMNSKVKSITLPNSIVAIGYGSFESCTGLTKINLPNGLKIIDDFAFTNCTSLKSISIPKSVTYLGEYAFKDCFKLATVANKSVITEIKDYTFDRCSSLKKIEIPSKVKKIGVYAITQTKIKELILPDSVREIGFRAFENCTLLSKVKMSKSIESVANDAFRFTPWLYDHKETFLIVNGVLIDGSKAKGDIVIPKTVRKIADGAFTNRMCDITSVTIPSTVKEIGSFAFSSCTSLKKVNLPKSITTIEYGTFMNCNSLESINIPSSVTSIGSSAFSGCDNLKTVTVSTNLKRIDDNAFEDCPKLLNIQGLGDNVSIHWTALKGTAKIYFYVNNKVDTIKVGSQYEFTTKNSEGDTNSNITWSVSDSTIATIDKTTGVIKGKKAGTVTVTAKFGDLSDTFIVQMIEPMALEIQGPREIIVGELAEYQVTGTSKNSGIEWSISSEDALLVDNYSTTNSLLAFKPGRVTLRVETSEGTGEITITIKNFNVIGPRTINVQEHTTYTIDSMGDGFDWCLYHDSVYEPFLGYGREVTIHVYQPGTYLLEVTHTDGGASVTIEITVEGSLEMDE